MALSSCAHQELVGVRLCNYTAVLELDQNQLLEKIMVILTVKNMHLRQREGKPIWSMVTVVNPGKVQGRVKAK